MNLDLIFESLQPNQVAHLDLLKQKLLDTYDINRVPDEALIAVVAEFANILQLKSQSELGHCLNPNFKIIDSQLAKMLLNVIATIQQRDKDYHPVLMKACKFSD